MPIAHTVLRALDAADRPAIRGPVGSRTAHTLAADVLRGAQALGPRPGLVAVAVPDPVDALVAVLATDLAGGTALVGDPSWSPTYRSETWTALAPDRLLDLPLPRACEDASTPGPSGGWPAPTDDDEPWAGFSAGATGRPRPVRRTRASWTGSFDAVTDLTRTGPRSAVLLPGTIASSLYCFAAVHALAVGAHVTFAPELGEAVAALACCDVVHTVPTTAAELLDALDAGASSTVRHLVVGGAELAARDRARAGHHGIDVTQYYGAVELSFVAVDTGQGLRPFPGVEVSLRPLGPSTRLAQLWVRSPWLSAGYLAGGTGPMVRDGQWASVGDLAERNADGALVLRGRGDGAIRSGMATVVPEDVEDVLRRVPGVQDVVVVGAPHRRLGAVVTAVVETVPRPGLRAHLERAARAGLAPPQRPTRWYGVPALPRVEGKPARGLVGAWVHDGVPDLEVLT